MTFRPFSSLMLLAAIALVGLVPLSAQDASVTATDLLGRTITLPAPAERIIPTNITALGQLLALGLEPSAIFCLPDSVDPEVYLLKDRNMPIPAGTPCISNVDWSTNWEAVAAQKPDLVIGWDQEEADAAEVIAPFFGTRTYTVTGQGDSFDMYDESLRSIARLTGLEDVAESVLTATRDRAKAYAALAPDDVTVLHVGTFDGKEFWVFGQGSLNCQLLDRMADCVAPGEATDFYISGTSEMLLSIDPDVILLVNSVDTVDNDGLMAILADDPLWNELKAVKDGGLQILPHDTRASSVWGITDYLNTVAPLLHPDLFPGPLTDEQVQEVIAHEELNATAEASDLSLVDGTGTTLTFDTVPQRIVCLYTRCLELLAALDVTPVGIMVSAELFATDPAYFSQPNDIALIDWEGDVPNMEQIAALQPDLVLGWKELVAPLEGIAPVYSVIDGQDSYQQSHEEIRAFAKLLGREDIAEANITAALDRLEAYKRLSPHDVSVMDMFFANETNYYRDGGSGTCNLLKEIALCDWADPQNSASWSVEVNDEGLLALDPDVIFVSSYGFDGLSEADIRAKLDERPLWAELKASQSGRIYLEPAGLNLDGMGTVGMTRMLDSLLPLIYPDVFPAPLTDEQVQDALAGAE